MVEFLRRNEIEAAVQRLWRGNFPEGCNGKFASAAEVGLDLRNKALPAGMRGGQWLSVCDDMLEVFIEHRAVGDFVPRLHVRRRGS